MPELAYYDYFPGVSVGEALRHPAEDFRFWLNLPNHPLIHLSQAMEKMGLQNLFEPVAELVANAVVMVIGIRFIMHQMETQ